MGRSASPPRLSAARRSSTFFSSSILRFGSLSPLSRGSGTREQSRINDETFRSGVREIALYVLFIVLFTVVTMTGDRHVQYRLQNRLDAHLFGDALDDIATVDDMWGFLDEHLVEAVWGQGLAEHETTAPERGAFVLNGANLIVGAVRLRQQRARAVPASECRVPRSLREHFPYCHFDLAAGGGIDGGRMTKAQTHEPRTPDGLRTTITLSPLASRADVRAALARLDARGWVDVATRLVQLELNLYNGNYDTFVTVIASFAIEASGGVWATRSLRPVRLRRSLLLVRGPHFFEPDAGEVLVLLCELGCIAMIVYYSARTLIEVRQEGVLAYFSRAWSIVHVAHSLLFWVMYLVRVAALVALSQIVPIEPEPSRFVGLEAVGALHYAVTYLNALNLVLVYLLEYIIYPGLVDADTKTPVHPRSWLQRSAFALAWGCYNLGVTAARLSVNVVRVRRVWLFTLMQALNFVLWFAEARSRWLARHGDGGYALMLVWMVWVGCMGGASYANCVARINHDEAIPDDVRELGVMLAFALVDTGLLVATGLSMVWSATIFDGA